MCTLEYLQTHNRTPYLNFDSKQLSNYGSITVIVLKFVRKRPPTDKAYRLFFDKELISYIHLFERWGIITIICHVE